mmetsp:Transcript_35690/g.104449  ORF Transcript_35690/g.104449 Transcript_35690/m.104449 type:complete len:231 (-) Transcript_35690:882-1574(-)
MQVGEGADDALLFRTREKLLVPFAQRRRVHRRPAVVWPAVEKVLGALCRRRNPQVRVLEAASGRVSQVAAKYGVVDGRARTRWVRLEVRHRIDVGDVGAVGVGRRAILVILLRVDGEEADITTAHLLEDKNSLREVWELVRVTAPAVALLELLDRLKEHPLARYDAHDDWLLGRHAARLERLRKVALDHIGEYTRRQFGRPSILQLGQLGALRERLADGGRRGQARLTHE